jgi:hypothetical protein
MRRHQFRFLWGAALLLTTLQAAYGGDDASGPTSCSVDLSQPFTTYSITAKDKLWSKSLTRKFGYRGNVVHFVRTSLMLKVGGRSVEGAVYQSVEKPEFFYVVPGDAMLKIGSMWAYSPGVGGFSMHAPKCGAFIVSLNFTSGGVPFLSSSPVTRGIVTWHADTDLNRLR